MKLIAIAGKAGAGKDTVSDILVRREGFKKVALADPLKELCSKVFNIDIKYFYDQNLKTKELPERVVIDYRHLDKIRNIIENELGFVITHEQREAMEDFFGDEIKTARELMQIVGTDIIRNCVRDDFWIVLFFTKIKDFDCPVVINDLRLKNEREALKKAGAHLILVKRDSDSKDHHISENDLGKESDYEVVIENNITKQQLESEVLMWYSVKAKHK